MSAQEQHQEVEEEEEEVMEEEEEEEEEDDPTFQQNKADAKAKRRAPRGEARAKRPMRRTQTPGGPDDYLIRDRNKGTEKTEEPPALTK